MKNLYLLPIMMIACLSFSGAQSIERQVISSLGQDLAVGNFKISMTVGEVVTGEPRGNNWLVTQGFQQGLLDKTSDIQTPGKDRFELKVFPNPVSEELQITYSENDPLEILVMDLSGRIITTATMQHHLRLSCSDWSSGSYFIVARSASGYHNSVYVVKPK